ncbi:MAG: hypothetical protein ACYS1A_08190 [Planctomycetota bacterium]
MKPIDFEFANRTLQKPANMTDDECAPLRVWTDEKECVSNWKLTWKERISALLFGQVWLFILNGGTQPPVALSCKKTVFEKVEDGISQMEGGISNELA